MDKASWLLIGLGGGLAFVLGWYRASHNHTPLFHQAYIPAQPSYQAMELNRLEQVLTAQPVSIPLLLEKARLQLTLNNTQGAKKTLQEICRMDPNNPDLGQWLKQAGGQSDMCP